MEKTKTTKEVLRLADTLDKEWVDKINKEGKHEIITYYRLQILYSERLRLENKQLLDSNIELKDELWKAKSNFLKLTKNTAELASCLKHSMEWLKDLGAKDEAKQLTKFETAINNAKNNLP